MKQVKVTIGWEPGEGLAIAMGRKLPQEKDELTIVAQHHTTSEAVRAALEALEKQDMVFDGELIITAKVTRMVGGDDGTWMFPNSEGYMEIRSNL